MQAQKQIIRLFLAVFLLLGVYGLAENAHAQMYTYLIIPGECCSRSFPSDCIYYYDPPEFAFRTQEICIEHRDYVGVPEAEADGYFCNVREINCGRISVAARCGEADGGGYTTEPPIDDLCFPGVPGDVRNVGSGWEWACKGDSGNAECSADDSGSAGNTCSSPYECRGPSEQSGYSCRTVSNCDGKVGGACCFEDFTGRPCVGKESGDSGACGSFATPGCRVENPVDRACGLVNSVCCTGSTPTACPTGYECVDDEDTSEAESCSAQTCDDGFGLCCKVSDSEESGGGLITPECGEGFELKYNVCVPTKAATGFSDSTVLEVIIAFLRWLFIIFGTVSIIAFIVAGFMYLTSGGDSNRSTNARRFVTFAIIGVVAGLSGLIILTAIKTWLDGTSTF